MLSKQLIKKISLFSVSGGMGAIIDIGVLTFLIHFNLIDEYSARVISIACAMVGTFLFNRNFTFEKSNRSTAAEGLRYGSVGVTSALINFSIYALIVYSIEDVIPQIEHMAPLFQGLIPQMAAAIASLFAAAFAYVGYSKFVFSSPREDVLSENTHN